MVNDFRKSRRFARFVISGFYTFSKNAPFCLPGFNTFINF